MILITGCTTFINNSKMQNFKTFYIVASNKQFWGKSKSLKTAIAFSKVNRLTEKFVIYQAILKEDATEYVIENLCQCFVVNALGGVQMYDNASEEDTNMVNEYLIGWIVNEDFIYSTIKNSKIKNHA